MSKRKRYLRSAHKVPASEVGALPIGLNIAMRSIGYSSSITYRATVRNCSLRTNRLRQISQCRDSEVSSVNVQTNRRDGGCSWGSRAASDRN